MPELPSATWLQPDEGKHSSNGTHSLYIQGSLGDIEISTAAAGKAHARSTAGSRRPKGRGSTPLKSGKAIRGIPSKLCPDTNKSPARFDAKAFLWERSATKAAEAHNGLRMGKLINTMERAHCCIHLIGLIKSTERVGEG